MTLETYLETNKITFGSVCSGIEAASMAWNPLGWRSLWFSEIEPFPSAVLEHHYPNTPNYGDMTKLPEMVLSGEVEEPDILVGGTPCQSFSVAGMRQGLSDARGQLTIKFVELADAIDTVRQRDGKAESIIVWENVPGVLSSKDNAFGCFLGALAGEDCELKPSGKRWSNAGFVLGPKRAIAWRVLDAQYFGLAQRRRRVFVVASARDGFCPAQVLFEFDGVRRDIAPSRDAGQKAAGDARASANKPDGRPAEIASTLNASIGEEIAPTITEAMGMGGGHVPIVNSEVKAFAQNTRNEVRYIGGDGQIAGALAANSGMKQTTYLLTNNCLNPEQPQCWRVYDPAGVAPSLQAGEARGNIVALNNHQAQAIAIQGSMIGRKPENGPQGVGYDGSGVCFTQTSVDRHAVALPSAVRRLTPVECERLQGFPDNWTQIPWSGKLAEECPDGHRYKALGNSMAVPVMRWIGERIKDELFYFSEMVNRRCK